MKKIISVLLVMLMLFYLCACGGEAMKQDIVVTPEKPADEQKESPKEEGKDAPGTLDPIKVEENLLSVEVTLPASLFDGESADEIKAAAKEKGIDCTVHEDGSVTYKMSKAKHKEVLAETKATYEEAFAGLIEGEDAVASFVKIEHSDDLSKFDVFVDPDKYTLFDNLYVLAFYTTGAYYQAFSGTEFSKVDVVVNFINNTTKEVMSTSSYREWQNGLTEGTTTPEAPKESDSGKVAELPTIEETVVLEHKGIKVTAKSYTSDSFWGNGIKLLIENDSAKNIGVSCDALIVNDYMISNFFVASVAAGKKANEVLYISDSELEAAGITNIGKVEVQLHYYDDTTYSTLHTGKPVEIRTSEYENMDTTAENVGVELFNDKGVQIAGKYVTNDSIWGTAIVLYIENNTDKNLTISCEDLSVNGFMIDSFFFSEVFAGKKIVDEISLSSDALDRNDIKVVEDIELVFTAQNSDTWKDVFKSEIIKFSAK